MKQLFLFLLFGLGCCIVGCDDATQSSPFPDKPFKLPDGTTAYPDGTLATHLDSPEHKKNAQMLLWPEALIDWLGTFRTNVNRLTPTTLITASEQSCFVLIELKNEPHPEVGVRDRRLVHFKLLAIEPHVDADAEALKKMIVTINGEAAIASTISDLTKPPQDVIDSAALFNAEMNQLAVRLVFVELEEDTYATGEYTADIQITFTDSTGAQRTDRIEAEFRFH